MLPVIASLPSPPIGILDYRPCRDHKGSPINGARSSRIQVDDRCARDSGSVDRIDPAVGIGKCCAVAEQVVVVGILVGIDVDVCSGVAGASDTQRHCVDGALVTASRINDAQCPGARTRFAAEGARSRTPFRTICGLSGGAWTFRLSNMTTSSGWEKLGKLGFDVEIENGPAGPKHRRLPTAPSIQCITSPHDPMIYVQTRKITVRRFRGARFQPKARCLGANTIPASRMGSTWAGRAQSGSVP